VSMRFGEEIQEVLRQSDGQLSCIRRLNPLLS
jgi:hypothetical protein